MPRIVALSAVVLALAAQSAAAHGVRVAER